MGYTAGNNPIHIVAGLGEGSIQIITAYAPTIDKWECDLTTGKADK
jgi:hypothetical protein